MRVLLVEDDKTLVAIRANLEGKNVLIAIEDDGAGIDADSIESVLMAGRRLDESVPGYGFGLAITRELTQLYGGELALARSENGGLKVEISLPTGE